MKNKLVLLIMLLTAALCFSQQQVTWEDLSKVEYTDKYYPEFDGYFMYPEFSPSLKAINGKLVTVKGYFLDVDGEGGLLMVSKGPMDACFFCGQGGPDTAVELLFANTPTFKTDDIVAITGTFKLNKDDVEHFNYILQDCKGVLLE